MMREYIFLTIIFCLILIAGIVVSDGKIQSRDKVEGVSNNEDISFPTGENSSGLQQKDEQQDIRQELRNLKLTSDILEASMVDLPDMIKAKRVRVLTTYSFSNYFVSEGTAYGYEYSQMEEYRKFLNKNKGRGELQVEFYYIPIPYDLLIPGLLNGYGDIVAANVTITPERVDEVDFTEPYLWGLKEVVLAHEDVKGIQSKDDLAGRKIHVREGSSYQLSLEQLNADFKARGLDPVEIVMLPALLNTGEIIEMVNAGAASITIADSHYAKMAKELLSDIRVYDQVVLNESVKYGWMVRKDNPELKASLNQFIKGVKKGTLTGNIYFNRYFKDNPWVKRALQEDDLTKLSKYVPLFQKYGEMYNMDWVLIAAQSFQESKFDPNARSHTGATGLMQLLPSTGKDMGFNDIRTPENNVHAGVKYLRWVMDRYFPEAEFTKDDRVRFALAAYNAGPANIRRSRQTTTDMGFDSVIWFGHSEHGTMKRVGLEPVQYVRNINKYYLAFMISEAISEAKKDIKNN